MLNLVNYRAKTKQGNEKKRKFVEQITDITITQAYKTSMKRAKLYILLTVVVVFVVFSAIALWNCYQSEVAENHMRYVGMMNVASEKIAKTIRGMEMSAMNEFDEVEKHLDSPESVIAALESKTNLNPEVRGYFAAFEPNYFPEKGQWFEPYVHHVDSSDFVVRQVGSARHNYHKSEWYIRAKSSNESFWSDPYYYYDGTDISGHYTTYVKPIFDKTGQLACVCGADMTFAWLSKELQRIDETNRANELQNKYLDIDTDFYTVVLNHDGGCIAHPEGKIVSLTEEAQLSDIEEGRSGMIDMDINGVPSMVYYGPIDHVNWSVAVVAAKQNVWTPMIKLGIIFLLISIIGVIIIWGVCRSLNHAKAF